MSDPNIKTVRVMNGASEPINIPTQSMPATNSMLSPIVKTRRTRKQNGGNKEPVAAALAPVINITKIDQQTAPNTIKGGNSASEQQQKSNTPPGPELPVTTGGSATKVVLKSKNRTAKVLLKKKLGGATNTTVEAIASGSTKTGGGKRKVVLKSITRRVKKTRHAVKHAKDLPLDKLKKILIEKKLIKPTSKAPESILRQIYADSLIVGKKML